MVKTMTMTTTMTTDGYGSVEISSGSPDPFAQVLVKADPIEINGGYRQVYGFAITAENAEKVDFLTENGDNWELIEYPFQSGAIEPIFVTNKPRILVLGSSKLYMRPKDRDPKIGFRLFDENDYRANKLIYNLFTQYAVFFVSSQGKLMHETPLKIRLKGVIGAQFARYYGSLFKSTKKQKESEQSAFCDALKEKVGRSSPLVKDATFFAQHAFEPIMRPEKKGQGSNSVNLGCIVGWKQRDDVISPEGKLNFGYRITSAQDREIVNEFVKKIEAKEEKWDLDAYFSRKKEQNQPNEMQLNEMIGVGAAYEYPAGYDDESFD